MKKTRSKKSRDTVPLSPNFIVPFEYAMKKQAEQYVIDIRCYSFCYTNKMIAGPSQQMKMLD
jgi:hypothetical protein